MLTKRLKDTYQIMTAIWPDIHKWLVKIRSERGIEEEEFNRMLEAALASTKAWYERHPFGSVKDRSSRALVHFLSEMERAVVEQTGNGIVNDLPVGVLHIYQTLEGST